MVQLQKCIEPNQTRLSINKQTNKQKTQTYRDSTVCNVCCDSCAPLFGYFCGGVKCGCLLSHDDDRDGDGSIDDEQKKDFHVVHCGMWRICWCRNVFFFLLRNVRVSYRVFFSIFVS